MTSVNRLAHFVDQPLLAITHSDRPFHEPSCDINYLERRYRVPNRLPPEQPFNTLRPASEYSPFGGKITLHAIDVSGMAAPDLVCSFRPGDYKPQHCIWHEGRLWVLGTERLVVYSSTMEIVQTIEDPWLAGAHTVAPVGGGAVLVSCSASDSVLRVDAVSGRVTHYWRLPSSLYGTNYDLQRSDSVVDHYITNDLQLTHVNSAWPWRDGVLVTTLIQGAVGWFAPDGCYSEILRGFVGAHGARVTRDGEALYFCDSCAGMLVFVNANGTVLRRVGTGSRWLHDAVQLSDTLYALAPFDQAEVLIVDVDTGEVVTRVACEAHGGPQFLSYLAP